MDFLIDHGAKLDIKNKVLNKHCTMYCIASVINQYNVIILLILFPSQEGRTALSLASYEGHSDTVRILAQRGANTDVQDEVGEGKVLSSINS